MCLHALVYIVFTLLTYIVMSPVQFTAPKVRICVVWSESRSRHVSGKDAIQHIIDTYNTHEQRSGNEVNGTGDEW